MRDSTWHFLKLAVLQCSLASSDLSNITDSNIYKRIGRSAGTLSNLTERVWDNSTLKVSTKMSVYSACILRSLQVTDFLSEESAFRPRYQVGREENKCRGTSIYYKFLRQRRLRWLVHRMQDCRIPKDLLYCELAKGGRDRGRPLLRHRDVFKRELKALDIDVSSWETIASDRDA